MALDDDGVINCDDVHTIYLDQLHRVIAPMTRPKLQVVEEALLVALGVDCAERV